MDTLRRWSLPAGIFLATCLGVFVLPFLLPPAPFAGVSAANTAGFNNKVSAIAAAFMGVLVLALALRKNWIRPQPLAGDYRKLSPQTITIGTILSCGLVAIFAWAIASAHSRYLNDTFYFLHQISMHADYGRKLYDQIEFPYGPLLFYTPILLRFLLKPFGVSLLGALLTTLVLMDIIGLLLVAWTINALPMLHRWRALLFVIAAIYTFQPNFGLNYTFFRFFTAAACIVLLSRQSKRWRYAATLFLGQILCLSISPEMGFAHLAAGLSFTLWRVHHAGRSWLGCLIAPLAAIPIFLLLAGGGYVRMLALFSRGALNFIVAPQPYTLIFLLALIWLVPPVIALFFQQQRQEWPLMGALYVLSLALLPVALGRADAGHIFFNEIAIFVMSFVAICHYSRWKQTLWAMATTLILLVCQVLNFSLYSFQLKTAIHHTLFGPNAGVAGKAAEAVLRGLAPSVLQRQYMYARAMEPPFEMQQLKMTGGEPVATPLEVGLNVEEALQQNNQLAPSFYCFFAGIVDRGAELRQVNEFNTSRWALIPRNSQYVVSETTASATTLGIRFPYREKRPPYVVGTIFYDNLAKNWQPVAEIEGYVLYKRH